MQPLLTSIGTMIGRGEAVDLSGVEQVALVFDPSQSDYAWVLRTAQPNPQLQEQLLQRLYDDSRQSRDEIANLPQGAAPAGFTDSNTIVVGIASLVNELKRRSGNSNMAAVLNAQGDRAAIAYFRIPQEVKDDARRRAEGRREDSGELAMYRAAIMTHAIIAGADFEPQLRTQISFQPEQASQAAELKQLVQQALQAFGNFMRQIQTREGHIEIERLLASVLGDVLQQGQWSEADHAVTYQWQATPEFTEQVPRLVIRIGNAVIGARSAARRASRMSQLKRIAVALHLYAERNEEHFPCNIVSADGKPLMSWRVELLPVLDGPPIYGQLRRNEPWDSAHNAALLKQVDPRLFAANPETPDGHADIQVVIGEHFGFSPADKASTQGISIAQFTDGMAYTVLLVEVAPERAVPWAKPDDYVWDAEKPTDGLGAKGEPFFLAAFGDTRVTPISKQESAETLRKAFGRNDGQPYKLMEADAP